MRMSQFFPSVLFILFGSCLPAHSVWDVPYFPPSRNPNFTLIESGPDHAVIRFHNTESNPDTHLNSFAYLGVPPDASYQFQITAWEIILLDKNKVERVLAGWLQSSPADLVEASPFLQVLLQTERFAFNDLDVLRFQFSFPRDTVINSATPTLSRQKFSPAMIELEVHWQEEKPRSPSAVSTLDAGYNRMWNNLLLNSRDAASLRRKRLLPDAERTAGFHPPTVGYTENGDLQNWADHPVAPRRDGTRVLVRKNGVVALRRGDLVHEGIDPSLVDLKEIRVWHRGVEQAACILDDGDGKLGDEDAMLFYGQESDSEDTNDTPYYVTWTPMPAPPKRVALLPQETMPVSTNPVSESKTFVSQNRILVMISANHYDWYDRQFDDPVTPLPLDLPELVADGDVKITLVLLNKVRSNVGFELSLGNTSEHFEIIHNATASISFVVPATQALSSPTLEIRLDQPPEPISEFQKTVSAKVQETPRLFLDSLSVVYPRDPVLPDSGLVFEKDVLASTQSVVSLHARTTSPVSAWWISNDELIQGVQGPRGMKSVSLPASDWDRLEMDETAKIPGPWSVEQDYPSTLHRRDQGYDYVMIAYHTMLEEARRLAARREKQGFQVLLADVQDIYDEWNYGYPSCDAIKRFLRYAQSEWQGLSPEFVVLIGESSWDRRQYEGYDMPDQVPTYTPPHDPQHFGSDEWYAYLWPENDETFSDVIVGRISLLTPSELKQYIDKIELYEDDAPVGPWKARDLFVADDTFERYSDESVRENLCAELTPSFLNQIDFPHETNPYLYLNFVHDPTPEAREYLNKKFSPEATYALIHALDESALLVEYFGHGGAQLWSHERIFYGTDRPTSNVLELAPTHRFPFILNWSCLTGYLNLNLPPFNVCLSEEFIRHADRGAIAVWAPSENGTTDQHMIMSALVVRDLVHDGLTRLGEACTFTKMEFLQTRQNSSLMQQYILFGDPAVSLALPRERLHLQVSPSRLLAQHEETFTVTTHSPTVSRGSAIVSLTVSGRNLYVSPPFSFDQGDISHTFSAAIADVEPPSSTIRVYAWNDETQQDAWGGATIPLMAPVLRLSGGKVTWTDHQAAVSFVVENPSLFPVQNIVCQVMVGADTHPVNLAQLPSQATSEIHWQGEPSPDLSVAYVSIQPDPEQGISPMNTKGGLVIPLQEHASQPVIPLLDQITLDPDDLLPSQLTRVQIPFLNLSGEQVVSTTSVLTGPGSATANHVITLDPRQTRNVIFNVTPREKGAFSYRLAIDAGSEHQEYSFPLEVLGKPDLALAEADILYTPQQPVIGKTVYLKTTLYNVGESPARNITISAYDGNPSKNVKLGPFNQQGNIHVDHLDPGETKELNITWDPYAYDGIGVHEINIVADSNNRIDELSEENNRNSITLTLSDLPDLYVNPWSDHQIQRVLNTALPVWGEPLRLTARLRNIGDSDADHVRLSLEYNRQEITRFFDRILPASAMETSIEVPLLSAKNTLQVAADKYDLIGEKNEADNSDNNTSREKRLYVTLQMPAAPLVDAVRKYQVVDETYFSAGLGDYTMYDARRRALTLSPQLQRIQVHVNPVFVLNPDNYDLVAPTVKWQWNILFNVFSSPLESDKELQVKLPAPNGLYDVFVQMYSPAYDQNLSAKILVKTSDEPDYQDMEHVKTNDPKAFHKIGAYSIRDDNLLLEFKAVPGSYTTNIGDVLMVHSPEDPNPVSTDYFSPYFPADGSGVGNTEMTWKADIPEDTSIQVKARWAIRKEDGSIRFLPWARIVDGKEEKLVLSGKGDYFQYSVELSTKNPVAPGPWFRQVEISIPCKES